MKGIKDKISLLENLTSTSLKTIKYFQADITKYKILIITIKNYYNNNFQTIEEILDSLPKEISSRAHKLNCITDASVKGYFIKETSPTDLRKKYLKPSEDLIAEFEEFIDIINVYNNISNSGKKIK
tara:strand:- start:191 stop:568 length:378 start_codon:yes stop_codon:yes gene_type:complete